MNESGGFIHLEVPMLMTAPEAPSPQPAAADGLALAVTYLRVSTKEQATKGGQDEGFSIPAQRAANHAKADTLGASIMKEFVDAGESAKKADRPELRKMLAYVREHRIAYCIVHKVDRLARNRADDVEIHLALREAGVLLVSATENIDETPSGMLLHGIMSSIAEFYSVNLAHEVMKGLVQKASTGGTPMRAPIGYRNTLHRDDLGREVRGIKIDEERAPLVKWAFTAYASGNYSLAQLRTELTRRGLKSVPTPKRASRPLGLSSVHRMLQNPYYKGDVVYRGVRYDGAHERLIEPEVWYQVQTVLRAHALSGVRAQKHDHYLKGTLYCGRCRQRMTIIHAKNRHGKIYPYFICLGRNNKRTDCTMPYAPADRVEKLVAAYYENITLTPAITDALRGMLTHEFDQLTAGTSESVKDLTVRRTQIHAEQDKLLEAHLADALSLEQLKKFQTRLQAELDGIEAQIAEHHNDYQGARALIDGALDLARDFARVYESCDDQNKRLANQTFFTRIYLDEDGTLTADTAAPFEEILDDAVRKEAIDWAETRSTTKAQSDVVTRDPFLRTRVTTSLVSCARGDLN
ncbi:MAG: recombinase family protein [Leucobacter sp.]